ncbi:hypothetical protein DACRYDRAFT_22198 [Dacryopinax primogenitus]|uniref:Uncharacterized protein n=1 Tax=Dacryopinax primogenitus (strain DJM 731) TaxID=1858805 RepID=M5FVH9_DACPD|nr:uncharacterized protein DACRYDRAFT_22198 [Dacryopinax primogenitus]EJU01816.1 hypothetical protein DACRYDRAFT_22198 [Dacryopinax primogenitus]
MIQQKNTTSGYTWPDSWELYLRVDIGPHPLGLSYYGEICRYYLIDRVKREVFWLHYFPDYCGVIPELTVHASSKLIRLHLQREFWAHMELFSNAKPIKGAEKELRDMLLWYTFDQITSPAGSTCPFEQGQPEKFLSVLDQFKGSEEDSVVKNIAIARLIGTCYTSRIANRFGDVGSRVDRGQPSLYSDDGWSSMAKYVVYCVMHVLVMGGDRWYLDKILNLTVDYYVPPQAWKDLVRMLVETSNQSTLIVAALLFTGNIGFLGINGLGGDQVIISIVATLLSLGSLFLGMQQALHHYDLKDTTADIGSQYCGTASQSWLGYRGLAVYYSLPSALLIWSAIATIIALLVWCFQLVEMDWFSRTCTILILLSLSIVGISAMKFSRRLYRFREKKQERACILRKSMRIVRLPGEFILARVPDRIWKPWGGKRPADQSADQLKNQEEGTACQQPEEARTTKSCPLRRFTDMYKASAHWVRRSITWRKKRPEPDEEKQAEIGAGTREAEEGPMCL